MGSRIACMEYRIGSIEIMIWMEVMSNSKNATFARFVEKDEYKTTGFDRDSAFDRVGGV